MSQIGKTIKHYSEAFKREKVKLYEEGKITVLQIQRMYGVSDASVYRWIAKYRTLPQGERLVVEKISEQTQTLNLMKKVAELERALGQAHLQLTYTNELLDYATNELGFDVKKKHESQSSKS